MNAVECWHDIAQTVRVDAVAPYTDPAWTPLFPGAGAIVVEVGSFLSHAGTVAREYRVPCLVDVHAATERIRSGQQLRVNASEGWVEIVE